MQKSINQIDVQKKLEEIKNAVLKNTCVGNAACVVIQKSNGTLKSVFLNQKAH